MEESKTSKKNEWKEREIGALWRNESHYSGIVSIDGKQQKIVIFKNKFKKEGTNEADLRIYTDKSNQS